MAPFLAAVAAFALSTGGFLSAFLAFLLFAGIAYIAAFEYVEYLNCIAWPVELQLGACK